MSRLKPKTDSDDFDQLDGRVEIYSSRIGQYKFVVLFKHLPSVWGRKQCLVYNGDHYKGRYVGDFVGMRPSDITGRQMPFSEVPTEIIEDAIRNI